MHNLARVLSASFLIMLVLAGCSDDEKDPSGDDDPSPTTSPTAPSSPATPEPTWRDQYSAEQLDAYDAALERWQEYTEKTHAIYEAGEDTPAARAVLREYSMRWRNEVGLLADYYDKGGLRQVRHPIALSSMPTSIQMNADGTGTVVISQCTDYSDLLLTQKGKEVPGTKPDHLVTPLTVNMAKTEGRDWMVATTELKDQQSCDA